MARIKDKKPTVPKLDSHFDANANPRGAEGEISRKRSAASLAFVAISSARLDESVQRELAQVENTKRFLDRRDAIDIHFESVAAEQPVLIILKFLAKRVEFRL